MKYYDFIKKYCSNLSFKNDCNINKIYGFYAYIDDKKVHCVIDSTVTDIKPYIFQRSENEVTEWGFSLSLPHEMKEKEKLNIAKEYAVIIKKKLENK